MNYCAKCILHEKTPFISFDSNGVCNYCKEHNKIVYYGEEKLLDVIKSQKSNKSKYDALVTLSGGRDSSYVLLKLIKDYGLNVLAVNYANPFTNEVAKENIRKLVEKLNVDFIEVNNISKVHLKTYKYIINQWIKKPSLAIFPLICVGCKLMWWEILKIAKKNNITLMVSGGNRFEDTSYKKALLGVKSDVSWEDTFLKVIKGVIKEVFRNPRYLNPLFFKHYLKAYLFGDMYSLGTRIFFKKIKKIDLFYYIEWNEEKIVKRLKSEIGWEYPEETNSSWRFDCYISYLKDYLYEKTINITEKDDFYAKIVREGLISREEALKRLEKENKIPEEYIKFVLDDANLTFKEFDEAIEKIKN